MHQARRLVPAVTLALTLVSLAATAQASTASSSQPLSALQPLAATPFELAGPHRFSMDEVRPDADDFAGVTDATIHTAKLIGKAP